MPLEISIKETRQEAYLITLIGQLDTNTFKKFEDEVFFLSERAKAIVIDLSSLTYISSMGLRSLARLRIAMSERGGTVLVVNPQPQIQPVLETVKVLSDDLLSTLEEADELLDAFLGKVQKGEIRPRKPTSPKNQST
jgi:anti-anti-sigma factor